jgi:L-seryl-tRNA(Ser) seleniumtransferase
VLVARYGRPATVSAVRQVLADHRESKRQNVGAASVVDGAADLLARQSAPSQRPVFNLTGTVLHTNFGRAPIPPDAASAAATALASATTLEFDLATGRRGERDDHVRGLLRKLTGASDATVVNNNAAAVLLVLNSLALGREVVVSRGELIEIGGSFRIPDVMARAGALLREVGTTNRTHARDFVDAIGSETAALMRVHQANYAITGFTAAVTPAALAEIAHRAGLPMIDDLGSGSLVDLRRWNLPHEPTPQESLAAGADLVTFSGDKLLGGPQAGIIVGRGDLIARLNANPLKRALRMDKGRIAALEQVLRLYLDPDRLAERLPAMRLLTRAAGDIAATAWRIRPSLAAFLGKIGGRASAAGEATRVEACRSQIGSGALPIDLLESWAVTLDTESAGLSAEAVAGRLRARPRPVIGRIAHGRLWLDCRCLEAADEASFADNLY